MKFPALSIMLGLALALPVASRAADVPASAKPAAAVSSYAGLESLVGGIWRAALPVQPGQPPVRIELRFAWNENKQGVRFDSTWFVGDKAAPYASGLYAWNAAKQKFAVFYTDSSASLTEGTVTQEGDVFSHEMTATNKDGSIDHLRVRLTKIGADVFTNEIFILKDGAWTKLVEVRYERKG